MQRKIGKYTRRGHRAHTSIPGGNPLAHGGNFRGGRSGSSRSRY